MKSANQQLCTRVRDRDLLPDQSTAIRSYPEPIRRHPELQKLRHPPRLASHISRPHVLGFQQLDFAATLSR